MKRFYFVPAIILVAMTSVTAHASGVQYTHNARGLQSVSCNGQTYVQSPNPDVNVSWAIFKAPDQSLNPYGYAAGAISNLNIGDVATQISSGTNPDFSQQIYRAGESDSFTVKWTYSSPDARTFKVDVDITNNDQNDTLKQIYLEYFMNFITPGPVLKEIPYLGANLAVGNGSVTSYLQGYWGSVVMYTDDYKNNWVFGSATNNYATNGTGPTWFLISLTNSSTEGSPANLMEDPILPGDTAHYSFYLRFGSPYELTSQLAPEAYSAFRDAFPYLVNWPDRRPIVNMFIGDGARNSATNPRSYMWDASVDVVPLDATKQATFKTRMLDWMDTLIARMDRVTPKPQGILIWDLEGDEFEQYFTYVGYPNKLPDLAPEMDAIANEFFKKFTDKGYKVGMTLRPGDFQTGPLASLPTTCTSGESTNHDLDDIYIATDALYPFRGYACVGENTWTAHGFQDPNRGRWPYHQHYPQDNKTLLSNLESKVAYAKARWGATMFYVDSTVYSNNGGGGAINFRVFRQLQTDFPDCIFFPENKTLPYWGASAGYMDARPQLGGYGYGTWEEVRNMYPNAFSLIEAASYAPADKHNTLVQAVRNGDILMLDNAWWKDDTDVLGIYAEAATPAPPVAVSSPVKFLPFKNYFNPIKDGPLSIYFENTTGGSASLHVYDRMGNTICALQDEINSARWDGKNAQGAIVASGTYSIILKAGGHEAKTKVVVIK